MLDHVAREGLLRSAAPIRPVIAPAMFDAAFADRAISSRDEWPFRVELVKRQPKEPEVKLPRLVMSAGKAPTQYPDPEDE